MIVWVTREETVTGPLCAACREAGLTVELEPVISRRVVDGAGEAIATLRPADWLVLSSVFAVEAIDQGAARVPRVAVIGKRTLEAAKARGFRVEHVSPGRDAQNLFRELRALVTSGVVCYPRSSLATPPQAWPGVTLNCPVLYETTPRDFDRTIVDRVEIATVASPSAVSAIGSMSLPFASIGPTTSAALRDLGIEPTIEAPERSFKSLAAAIADYARDSRHQRA